ncbi:MAG: LamG domain-containing protein, partial [Dehalococcoidia bacterium]|nr:LamG domain-containing protein [Dehalococcoidia bacterium]
VIGAEKHDIDPATYRPFRGLVDELRVSRVLRYSGSFTRPSAPFQPDADTVGLYHFDEGGGTVAIDSSGAPGGPSNGIVRVGGPSNGPQWVTDTPFGAAPSPTPSPSASPPPPRTPSPPTADTRFAPMVARNRQP